MRVRQPSERTSACVKNKCICVCVYLCVWESVDKKGNNNASICVKLPRPDLVAESALK